MLTWRCEPTATLGLEPAANTNTHRLGSRNGGEKFEIGAPRATNLIFFRALTLTRKISTTSYQLGWVFIVP